MKYFVAIFSILFLFSCTGNTTMEKENQVDIENNEQAIENTVKDSQYIYVNKLAPEIQVGVKEDTVDLLYQTEIITSQDRHDITETVEMESQLDFIRENGWDEKNLTDEQKKLIDDNYWKNYFYIKDIEKSPEDVFPIYHRTYEGSSTNRVIDTKTDIITEYSDGPIMQIARGENELYILYYGNLSTKNKWIRLIRYSTTESHEIELKELPLEEHKIITENKENCEFKYTAFELLDEKKIKLFYEGPDSCIKENVTDLTYIINI